MMARFFSANLWRDKNKGVEGLSPEVLIILMIGVDLKSDKEGIGEKMWLRENENRVGTMNWSFQWSQRIIVFRTLQRMS